MVVSAGELEARRIWRSRIRRWLKPLPRRSNVHRYPVIRFFGERARKRPYLWSWKRPQMTRSYYIGWVVTLLPIGGVQILLAVLLCMLFRANIPIAAALQFVSNPFTAAPILITTYNAGKAVLSPFGYMPGSWVFGLATNLSVGALVVGLGLGGLCHLLHLLVARRR